MITCPNCNCVLDDNSTYCHNCGCFIKSRKKFSFKIIILAVVIALVVVSIFVSVYAYNSVKKANYLQEVKECAYLMLEGMAAAEESCNKIVAVWNNCINMIDDIDTNVYTTDDFGYFYYDVNNALEKLFDDDSFKNNLTTIKDNVKELSEKINLVQNPPKGYENIHDLIIDLYNDYYLLINYAINPAGSLESYLDNIDELDKEGLKTFNKLLSCFE